MCIHYGFPYGAGGGGNGGDGDGDVDVFARYMTGEDSMLVDHYPELMGLRDIVFLFKLRLAPTSDALPPINRWTASHGT